MKVTSPMGAVGAPRNVKVPMLTQVSTGAATNAGSTAPPARPVKFTPPPPRASSFGGADPRAMFEALVQRLDSDGDGKLSLDEVNALNQGGLLSRSFGRVDGNADGGLSGDEIAAARPWGNILPTTGNSGSGDQGSGVRPQAAQQTGPVRSGRDAALIAQDLAAINRAELGQMNGAALTPPARPNASPDGLARPADPATLMESMVMALSTQPPEDVDVPSTGALQQAATLR